MQIGFIGLGKMGSRMAKKLLEAGHEVVVWNRSQEGVSNFKLQISNSQLTDNSVVFAETIPDVVKSLPSPKIIWCMLPAGDVTEQMLSEISGYIEKDAIVIDGGNAHFSDTQRRYEMFQDKGFRFLGIGVSGGVIAGEKGYPLMVGGDRSAYDYIKPILESLSQPHGGFDYFGTGGAGHFVKMVHNAIEYGMMQSFGEGFGILDKSPYDLDLVKIGQVWQKGSIVSSFLLDRAVDALQKDAKLSETVGLVAASGEAEWAIEEAKKEQVPVEVIATSLSFRQRSQSDSSIQQSFAAKMVAALRYEFGGHEVKKSTER